MCVGIVALPGMDLTAAAFEDPRTEFFKMKPISSAIGTNSDRTDQPPGLGAATSRGLQIPWMSWVGSSDDQGW